MKKRYRKKRYASRRRKSLDASKWGPLVKLTGAFFGIAAAGGLLVFGVMLLLEAVFKIDTPLSPNGIVGKISNLLNVEQPLIVTPTPYVPPVPTPTPHPMDLFDVESEETEIVLTAEMQYTYFSDPYCFNNTIIFSAGKVTDGKALLNTLIQYSLEDDTVTALPYAPKNDHLLFPVFNDKWLVFFDAKYSGGGSIYCVDLTDASAVPREIKEVYVGQPELKLSGDYMAWMERTGTEKDKLFVCDLNTEETTALQSFTNSAYGTSLPSFVDELLLWADEDDTYYEDGRTTSSIHYIKIGESTIKEFLPGTYVHDPEGDGEHFAWLDSHHGQNSILYVSNGTDKPKAVAEGVVEFGFSDEFVAYGMNDAIWIYVFANQKTYRITPEREMTQFLGVSGNCVMWMDVTSRERDVIKYAKLPI